MEKENRLERGTNQLNDLCAQKGIKVDGQRALILLNICILFHQDFLNGFQVIERALFCNGTATYKYYYKYYYY